MTVFVRNKIVAKLINKKIYKKSEGKCRICGETDYDTLDVHRAITEGKDGGKYTLPNSVCSCCKCHRKIHAGKIKILGWCNSTKGQVLHIIREDGKEDFV